jgi:hypothetical protein
VPSSPTLSCSYAAVVPPRTVWFDETGTPHGNENRVVTAIDGSTRPSVTSNKALVRPLRNIQAYSSIFVHILENIQRICQLCPIPNGQNRPSVTSLYDRFTPPSVIYDNPE